MKRFQGIPTVLALFLIVYVPLFFSLSLCNYLSDADVFAPPAFEAPDLLSEPACSLGNEKFVVSYDYQGLIFNLNNDSFDRFLILSFQIPSLDLTTAVLRC